MKIIELENKEWEEFIKYYYIEKTEGFNQEKKIEKILILEKIDNSIRKELSIEVLNTKDFKEFLSKSKIENDKIVKIQSIKNDWDFKFFIIETLNYFIVRIWETTA